jgi:hypothetical protein
MTNLTTLQSRAAFQGMFINDDVKQFNIIFDGVNYQNLIAGLMIVLWGIILLGRIASSSQATILVDLVQAVVISGKLMLIVARAIVWGVFG